MATRTRASVEKQQLRVRMDEPVAQQGQRFNKVHEFDFTSGAPRLPSSGIAQLSPSTACIPASSRPSSMRTRWWIPILLVLGADEL